MSKPIKTFPGTDWTGYLTDHKCKAVRNSIDADHWTARFWINMDGGLTCELPCKGNHVIEVLPKTVLQWLTTP